MALPRAYAGTGDTTVARPYIEIQHNDAADDITVSTTDINWVWSGAAFDTTDGAVTFDGVDELTIVTAATYRIDLHSTWRTVDNTRMFARVDRDPLGGGSYAEIRGSKNAGHFFGSDGDAFSTITVALDATDKLRVTTRRLVGTAPSTTRGVFGASWRLTKLD